MPWASFPVLTQRMWHLIDRMLGGAQRPLCTGELQQGVQTTVLCGPGLEDTPPGPFLDPTPGQICSFSPWPATTLKSVTSPPREPPRTGRGFAHFRGTETPVPPWLLNHWRPLTSRSRALKNECKNERVFPPLSQGRAGHPPPPPRPGVAAPFPLLCLQQERFIEKS